MSISTKAAFILAALMLLVGLYLWGLDRREARHAEAWSDFDINDGAVCDAEGNCRRIRDGSTFKQAPWKPQDGTGGGGGYTEGVGGAGRPGKP